MKSKSPKIEALSPMDENLWYHMLRAHLQVMLWKAADEQSAPLLQITSFGWEIVNGVP